MSWQSCGDFAGGDAWLGGHLVPPVVWTANTALALATGLLFFFQAEDGIRDLLG
jgi:hypothetical protein